MKEQLILLILLITVDPVDPVDPVDSVDPTAGDFGASFGGTTVSEGGVYTHPSSAEIWGGFANVNFDMCPSIFRGW